MIDHVIVALDGSELAREAFEYAALIADAAGAELSVLHVAERLPIHTLQKGGPDDDFMQVAEAIRCCESYCEWREMPLEVNVVDGHLIDCLASRSNETTLIVVGLKGRFARVGVGSTTSWLIHHARGPILVVTGQSQRQLNRVLTVYDGCEASRRATAFAERLAAQTKWPLTVLAAPGLHQGLDDVLEGAQAATSDGQVITLGSSGQSEAAQVERVAGLARHALLVLGAYPDSWIHQLFTGGTTGHILKHVKGPIVVVR